MAPPALSVIVPVHNRIEDLTTLLAQLNAQREHAFEVVVVDDGSAPPVSESIRPEFYRFRLVLLRRENRGGIGAARNAGVRAASGDLILFIDSDSQVLDPECIEKHAAVYRQGVPALGIASGATFVLHSKVIGIHSTYAGYSFGYANWFVSCMPRARIIEDHHVPSNNTCVPRQVFDRVGLFDEGLEVAEDIDFAFRCRKHGIPLVYVPDVPLHHADRDSFRDLWRSFVKMGEFAWRVRKLHPGSPYRYCYPFNRITGWLYFVPLSALLTVYIVARWLACGDLRVLLYVPGIHFANVAYCVGVCKALRVAGSRDAPHSG